MSSPLPAAGHWERLWLSQPGILRLFALVLGPYFDSEVIPKVLYRWGCFPPPWLVNQLTGSHALTHTRCVYHLSCCAGGCFSFKENEEVALSLYSGSLTPKAQDGLGRIVCSFLRLSSFRYCSGILDMAPVLVRSH